MAVFSGNGSSTSPSFTFSSDTDTGIYRADTDRLSISTAGVDAITVADDQKVGIGTGFPSERLTVDNGNVLVVNGAYNTVNGFVTHTPLFLERGSGSGEGFEVVLSSAVSNVNSTAKPLTLSQASTESIRVGAGWAKLGPLARLNSPTLQTDTQQWVENDGSGASYRIMKQLYGLNETGLTILTITVPNAECLLFIDAKIIATRASASLTQTGTGQSRVSKVMWALGRETDGDVVIDSDINSLNFEVQTTTAGGGINPPSPNATLQRAGVEPASDPQEVEVTVDVGTGGSGARVYALFDIMIAGPTSGIVIS